jgi:hypothetical protein
LDGGAFLRGDFEDDIGDVSVVVVVGAGVSSDDGGESGLGSPVGEGDGEDI